MPSLTNRFLDSRGPPPADEIDRQPTMRTLKLTLAYDGTAYAGWQVQPGQATIQATLEAALEKVTGESIRVLASGRTDAGVHAAGQVMQIGNEVRPPQSAREVIWWHDLGQCSVVEDKPEGARRRALSGQDRRRREAQRVQCRVGQGDERRAQESRQRQIVGGLAGHYAPDELVGRQVVVVANLATAKLMGLESQGMLLAAVHGDSLALLVPDREMPVGASVS